MATATATFPKKTVYHSALRNAGPLTVAFTSEVKESQYRGKPPYVEFKVQGDDSTYQYNVENEGIAALIKDLPRNEWIEVQAEGTKEEADLLVTRDIHSPKAGSGDPPPAPARRQAATPPPPPDSNGDSLALTFWRCLDVSASLCDQFKQKHGREMTENDRSIAISLAIEVHRGNKLPLSR